MCQKSLSADERRKAARRVSCVGKGQVASVACTPGRGCGRGSLGEEFCGQRGGVGKCPECIVCARRPRAWDGTAGEIPQVVRVQVLEGQCGSLGTEALILTLKPLEGFESRGDPVGPSF